MHNVQRAKAIYLECIANPKASLPMLRQELSSADVLVRHLAAVQLALHHPTEVPARVAAEMLATLLSVSKVSLLRSPLVADYWEATATEDDCHDLGQDIAFALANLPPDPTSPAIIPLIRLWQRDRQFYEAALAALALAFPKTPGRVSAASLNATQQSVLRALVASDTIWTLCGDTEPLLADRGLPTYHTAMQAFLRAADESEN